MQIQYKPKRGWLGTIFQVEILQGIDQDLVKGAVAGEKFSELFFASCKDEELAAYVKTLL